MSYEQVGGTHYANMAIQPWEYISENGLNWAEGNVVKYVSRWRRKNGIEDLKKARQMLDMLIEFEERGTRNETRIKVPRHREMDGDRKGADSRASG